MLMPKKVKFRKQQRGRMARQGVARRRRVVRRLRAEGARAVLADRPPDRGGARRDDARFVARGGKIWTRVFPDKPITKKPQETRMGKGKGAPEQWVCVVQPGPRAVRDGRRQREGRARGDEAGGREAADSHEVRDALRAGEDAMKAAELRDLGADELGAKERDLTDQLFRLRIQKSMGQLEAPAKVRIGAPRSRARQDGAAAEGAG